MIRKCFIAITLILSILFSTSFVFAAADPYVTIVSPVSQSTTSANNLLISVKITQPKVIRVYVYEKKMMVDGVPKSINLDAVSSNQPSLDSLKNDLIMSSPNFVCSNNLSFYTKQLDITPGLYLVRVDTIDSAGKVKYTNYSYVGVKANQAAPGLFESEQSGTFQFLQNILKSIF